VIYLGRNQELHQSTRANQCSNKKESKVLWHQLKEAPTR